MGWKWAKLEWPRFALAAAGGLLLAGAFPKINVVGLAWIAPGLILAAGMGGRNGTAFRAGYVAGIFFFLGALYWLLHIPVPVAPIVGWLLLAAFLALFPAMWVWLCTRISPGGGRSGSAPEQPGSHPITASLHALVSQPWWQRQAWALACAAAWVAWEMVQARIFTGFPWNLLGASQYTMLPLIQIASLAGVYAVSFLIVWFSVSLLQAVGVLLHQRQRYAGALAEVFLPLLVIAICIGWGTRVVLAPRPSAPEIPILLVQPSIPQTTIWDAKQAKLRFAQLMELSERALNATHPKLLLWPEAAVPNLLLWDREPAFQGKTMFAAVSELARKHRVWMIIGADDAEPRALKPNEADFYNSSFLISPAGEVVGKYRKKQLVIFGEYVPLSGLLPFIRDFIQVYGEFARGKGPVAFALGDAGVRTSVLICFEDIFPHLARNYVFDDTDFLVNLTNNGWFGESAAQWQHAANAVFRAVENRLPLVRAANNGLSCWVDERGGMHDVYFPGSRDVYQAGFKLVRVPLLYGNERSPTWYRRHGDWFGWSCVLVTSVSVIFILSGVLRKRPTG